MARFRVEFQWEEPEGVLHTVSYQDKDASSDYAVSLTGLAIKQAFPRPDEFVAKLVSMIDEISDDDDANCVDPQLLWNLVQAADKVIEAYQLHDEQLEKSFKEKQHVTNPPPS